MMINKIFTMTKFDVSCPNPMDVLQVMKGGFVSGRMLAALPGGDVAPSNEHFLTAAGLQQLASALECGKFRVQVGTLIHHASS
jgi:hypothetical protein